MIFEDDADLNMFFASIEHIEGWVEVRSTSTSICEQEQKKETTAKRVTMHLDFIIHVFRFCCESTTKTSAQNMISSFVFLILSIAAR